MKASSFLKIGVTTFTYICDAYEWSECILLSQLTVFSINLQRYWRQFSKSWTPSFLPYPCSLSTFLCVLWLLSTIKAHKETYKIPTPVCFFLLYYIYSKCMYFWVEHLSPFYWRQFSKSWTPSFLPYPCSLSIFLLAFFVAYPLQKQEEKYVIPTPVCFFLLYYIYSKCMFFWMSCFTNFRWRQFSKSWTLSFLPYPCSWTFDIMLFICYCSTITTAWYQTRIPTPVCFFLFYYIIINNMYITQNYFSSSQKSTIKITSFFITRVVIMKPWKWWFFRTPAGALA